MGNFSISSTALQLLIEAKRILKTRYDVQLSLNDENVVDQLCSLATKHHDESLYDHLFQYWDELEKLNPKKSDHKRIMEQRLALAQNWAQNSNA